MSDDVAHQILAIVTRLGGDMGHLSTHMTSLHSAVDDVRQEVVDLKFAQTSLRTELSSAITTLTSAFDDLRQAVADLKSGQTSLRTELIARMDRLQDSITAIRDDIGVNYAASDRAHEANENTRKELRALGEMVSGMLRQIQRLQTEVRVLKGDV